ncbi:MAG: DedA family protein [Proteobacteria bacterium]|nr:DedA family protein [Pseudomonadota bacterium]
MYELFLKAVDLVESIGYVGIFLLTFVESTFVPIPAEVTLVPAGYLVSEGKMDFWMVSISAVCGTIGGSLLNYSIAYHFGRHLFINYGRYFFMNEYKLQLIEFFFERHGAISTFSGRLLPGIKHVISFPAGLAKMNLRVFIAYTTAGGALYNTLIVTLGYYIGENKELIKKYMMQVNVALVISIILLLGFYIWRQRQNRPEGKDL